MKKMIQQEVLDTFKKQGLAAVFRDILGWDTVSNEIESFTLKDATVSALKIASLLNGVAVLEFSFSQTERVLPHVQNEISKAVSLKYPERLLIFTTRTTSTWLWPKLTAGGTLSHEKLDVPANTLPRFLAQRLVSLRVTSQDMMTGLSVTDIRDRLRGAFNTTIVTKKFFEKFRDEHQQLASRIRGLESNQAASYATLMLNRLMFIYFLQKKEFLNNDLNYLKNCFDRVRALESPTTIYSFYKDLLLVLFFEGLNSRDSNFKSPEIASILGSVPYINGGLFSENELEQKFEIEIDDDAFISILDFFDQFTWHLDTRPTGNDNEINPEVLGYIFEQYINFTAGGKKENGAYYTKHDVTAHMVSSTLVPKVLDLLASQGLNALAILPKSGTRYVPSSLLHGWNEYESEWASLPAQITDIWASDPSNWGELDSLEIDPASCLPGESWVEALHRRERCNTLVETIAEGRISSINDLITHNLDSHRLLLDSIEQIDEDSDLEAIWAALSDLSVIDPTCGSGAFLFGALEILEDLYSALLDAAENLPVEATFSSGILNSASAHPNRRYFIRKNAALNNLYGTDLMPDAVETAKLRIFLALASCLEDQSEIEPLPDLDLNLKAGNLVVGFLDSNDARRVGGNQLFASLEIEALEPKVVDYMARFQVFKKLSIAGATEASESKLSLIKSAAELRDEANRIYAGCIGVSDEGFEDWVNQSKPFHWFAEFPQVIKKGGFDVIIGNPPYVKRSELNLIELPGYLTSNCPDLYAICYERSLQLLAPSGRHAFIVMLSLAAGEKFSPLRKLISDQGYAEWWSTYGKRPDSLFAGVQVRNTILILGPGNQKFATLHNIFKKDTRTHLFSKLEYHSIPRDAGEVPLRAGIANQLAAKIKGAKAQGPLRLSTRNIYIRGRAQYWYPALPGRPKMVSAGGLLTQVDDPNIGFTALFDGEPLELSVALLAGKIGYLWWSATGDDFNSLASTSVQPRILASVLWKHQNVMDEAKRVLNAGMDHAFGSSNASTIQLNIRWNAIRSISDDFDRAVLEALGLLDEWKPLNIWYRQTMKSSGDNANSMKIASTVARAGFSSQ
jgi:hypothetical protein